MAVAGVGPGAPEENSGKVPERLLEECSRITNFGNATNSGTSGTGKGQERDAQKKVGSYDSQRHDKILRIFLRPEIWQNVPHFGAISLLNKKRKPGRKSTGENSKKSSGDNEPRSQISVPCPLHMS